MNRQWILLVILVPVAALVAGDAFGQTANQLRKDRLRGQLDIQRAAIGEQAVQRQTEVVRLEKLIEQMESRVVRLERQLIASARLPAITIAESQAALQLAEAQLAATERLLKQGKATEIEIARDRLGLARARGQHQVARAAQTETLFLLELDVLAAQRRLREETQQQSQMERLVAKGYVSSDGLHLQSIDVDTAKKHLQITRLRLETQQKLSSPESSGDKAAKSNVNP